MKLSTNLLFHAFSETIPDCYGKIIWSKHNIATFQYKLSILLNTRISRAASDKKIIRQIDRILK